MTAHDRNEFARAYSLSAKNREQDKQIDLFKEEKFKYFFDGTITKFGSEYIIDATVSDIETNTVQSSCNSRITDKLDYNEMINNTKNLITSCIKEFPIIAGRIKALESGDGNEGSRVVLDMEETGQYEGNKMVVYGMDKIGDIKTYRPSIVAEGNIINSRGYQHIGKVTKLHSYPVKTGDIIQVIR